MKGMIRQGMAVALLGISIVVTGCNHSSIVRPLAKDRVSDEAVEDRSLLAGEWEYEDGAAVMLRLDEQGNGSYEFKDGRFETITFADHTWVGKWYQRENDREGGFIVKLSADYQEGEGTWWYVRIGEDHMPSEKGGTFRLSRKTSVTLSETPPAP